MSLKTGQIQITGRPISQLGALWTGGFSYEGFCSYQIFPVETQMICGITNAVLTKYGSTI